MVVTLSSQHSGSRAEGSGVQGHPHPIKPVSIETIVSKQDSLTDRQDGQTKKAESQ